MHNFLFFDVAPHWGRITGTASSCKNAFSDDVMSEHVRAFELSAEQARGLRNWKFLHVRVKVQILVRSNFLSLSWLDEHRYLIRYQKQLADSCWSSSLQQWAWRLHTTHLQVLSGRLDSTSHHGQGICTCWLLLSVTLTVFAYFWCGSFQTRAVS